MRGLVRVAGAIAIACYIQLFLTTREPTAPLIALLRRYTGKGMNDLRQAIMAQQPVLDVALHDMQQRIAELLDELEARGVLYTAEVDGARRDPHYLRNILQTWRKSSIETEQMTDLESRAPNIGTLEWLKQEAPRDVFRATLDQIVQGHGYTRDEATIAWAQRELE